ncbi:MAG: glycosyltransferase family 39 protein [Polyangiales bacterium]
MSGPRAQAFALGALLLLALALRLPALESLPNPCGDEGNWAWYGVELAAGHRVALAPDARFVTLAFAHLIALSLKLFGHSFAAVRAPLVAGVALGMVGAFALARGLGRPRAGLVVAALLAAHPWSVMWSRTATVPYALALCTMTCAPLALLAATRQGGARRWVVAGALLAAGLHFSPLALLTAVSCAGWMLSTPAARAQARAAGPWLALASAGLVASPVVLGAIAVAREGSTRPRHLFTVFGERLGVYLRTLLGAISGESTLRHFVAPRPSLAWELAAAAGVVAVVVAACWPRRDDDEVTRSLASLTRWGAMTSMLGTAVLLAPARTWNLPGIDAERYGFAVLAPFALALATAASRRRGGPGAWLLCALALVGPTRATLSSLRAGSGRDEGVWTLRGGGGYRGWKTSASAEAIATRIARDVDALRAGGPATIVVADYAFHTLPFATGDAPVETVDVAKRELPRAPGRPHLFVRWSDGLLAPRVRDARRANDALTALMRSARFTSLRLVRRLPQRDGAALLELWSATHAP